MHKPITNGLLIQPPRDAEAAVAELVEKAQGLCAADYEAVELQSKVSMAYNKKPYMTEMAECEQKVSFLSTLHQKDRRCLLLKQ